MATALKNLSDNPVQPESDVSGKTFALVVADWNAEITEKLCAGAIGTLSQQGVPLHRIVRKNVPGSFELCLGAQWMAARPDVDAVICLGCVIQGDTRHFDFICAAVAHGLTDVGLKYNKPVIFGVLTTNDLQQALDRAGGKHGNKGDEAAATAIRMLQF